MTEILISSSALILALLVIRKLFRKNLSRRVQYALWALVLIRLLVPRNLPSVNFSVLRAAKPVEKTVTQTVTTQPIYVPVSQGPLEEHPAAAADIAPKQADTFTGESVWVAQTEQQTAVEYKRLSAQTVLSWIWIAGSCCTAVFLLFANVRFWLWLRKVRKPYEIEDCKLRVYLVETGLPSPCLFGLFRPAIYLTPGALESEESLGHVIAHETTHARHLDHLWTLLRGVCLALYWFDPLVWAAASASKTDCELACDEGALAKLGERDRIPYGKTLLSLLPVRQAVNPLLATTAMSSGKKHLKDRFTRIAKKSRQTAAAVVAAAVLVAAVSACTFTGGDSGKVVVCFDIANQYSTDTAYLSAIKSFLGWIDDCNRYRDFPFSSEDIEVEVIPGADEEPAARAGALQKVRAEIMAGKGPDVFICSMRNGLAGFVQEEMVMEGGRLFPYVERTRESGVFLPLDDLLSEWTLTNPDELIPTVLEGGKNQNGEQVIIPLIYMVPGTVFTLNGGSNYDVVEESIGYDFAGTSWYDVLTSDDPVLVAQRDWPMNYSRFNNDRTRVGDHSAGLSYLLPKIADFQTEELAFSEEELASLIQDSMDAYRQALQQERLEQAYASLYLSPWSVGSNYDAMYLPGRGKGDISFVPLRNLEGGSTASVTAFCAVNANTKRKEKAIKVIDALLGRDLQKGGKFYEYIGGHGMPINRDLGSEEHPYLNAIAFKEERFEHWQKACEDINIVRFPSPLDEELDTMMKEIEDAMYTYRNPISGIIQRNGEFTKGRLTDEELLEIVSRHCQEMRRLIDES